MRSWTSLGLSETEDSPMQHTIIQRPPVTENVEVVDRRRDPCVAVESKRKKKNVHAISTGAGQ